MPELSFQQLREAGFSDDEILADAGFSPDEIAAERGPQAPPNEAVMGWNAAREGVLEGLSNVPGAALNAITAPVSALGGAVAHPVDTYSRLTEALSSPEGRSQALTTVGKGAAGVGGALAAAALLPSAPILAAGLAGVGAVGGNRIYDRLNEALGNVAPQSPIPEQYRQPGVTSTTTTTFDPNRAAQQVKDFANESTTAAGVGAGFAGAGQLLENVVAPKLQKAARAEDRASLGAGQRHYAATANDLQTVALNNTEVQTLTKQALDDLLSNNKLGTTREPSVVAKNAADAQKRLGKEVGELIKDYEKANPGAPITPQWQHTLDALDSGDIPAHQIDHYMKILDDLDAGIQSKGKGKLRYIQNQKMAIGRKWNPADTTENEFHRALYSDLKETVEAAVPASKEINKEIQKYIIAEKVVRSGLTLDESANLSKTIFNAIKTSGGVGVPLLTWQQTGNPLAGLVAALMLGSRTRTGMKLTSDILDVGSSGASKVGPIAERLAPILATSGVR